MDQYGETFIGKGLLKHVLRVHFKVHLGFMKVQEGLLVHIIVPGYPKNCHNPNDDTTHHNLNTVVWLDTKMTVQTPPNNPTPPHRTNSTAASMSLRTTFIDDN